MAEKNHEIYEYVEEAFLQVERGFRTADKVAVEMATGTGKSCVTELFIKAHRNDRILFLTSGNPLLEDFREKVKTYGAVQNLMEGIYQSFKAERMVKIAGTNRYEMAAFRDLDWLIVDEYHALGAECYWHEYKNLLRNNPKVRVLGLTATPIRSDGEDMCATVFHGNCVYRLDLETAMRKRILGRPKYYVCYYQNDTLCEIVEKKKKENDLTEQQFVKVARRTLEKSNGLGEIFQEVIGKRKKGKYMVFCRNNDHMMKMIRQCREEWFRWAGDDQPGRGPPGNIRGDD